MFFYSSFCISLISSRCLIIRAGTPATTHLGGTSFVTTEPVPTTDNFPIVTPGRIIHAGAILDDVVPPEPQPDPLGVVGQRRAVYKGVLVRFGDLDPCAALESRAVVPSWSQEASG